jgi:uncharacterized membrane-anchored protein
MKNKTLLLVLFLVVALLQWLVPISSVYRKNIVEASGKSFCFKMRPVDPAHPFAGRYMALQFDQNSTPLKPGMSLKDNAEIYLEISEDENQYAMIKDMALEPFTHTTDYIRATVQYYDSNRVFVNYPFDRYYMGESKAKATEDKIVPLLQDSTHRICAMVKVLGGETFLQDIYIDNQALKEWK